MPTSNRIAEHAIDQQFTQRWSPRAFTDESIDKATLLSFFEAARWAPRRTTRSRGAFCLLCVARLTSSVI